MITNESINFLRNIPPYQFLDEDTLRSIAGNLSLEFFPKNTYILTQEGPPSLSLRVIKKGGVKISLANEDEMIIDYRSEGDSFGYVSLISGDKSRANVVAVEDTICYQIPKDIILQIINTQPMFGEYFMKSFFKNYIDRTYKEMRNKNLLFKEGEKLLYTTHIEKIISAHPITARSDISIKEAAAIMSQNRISALILTDREGSPAGIITDRDMRDKVVAEGRQLTSPATDIMSSGLVTIDSQSTCFDALSTMIKHNIHHLLVTKGGVLSGVVTNHDFMLMQGTSPLSILKNIDRQKNAEELVPIRDNINQTLAILLKEGVGASHILRIITELHDRLIMKIIDLSIGKIGSSHCPFAFFVYGAEGRREETFKTVFHCAIVYDNEKTYCEKKDIDEYCQYLIENLQDTLGECGLPLFDTAPLGKDVPIFGDISEWESKALTALRSRNNDFVMTAKKILDSRTLYGNASIVEAFRERIYRKIREDETYGFQLMDDPAEHESSVGFFKKFFVSENGEQFKKFDMKERGITPIVDAVRAMSVKADIHETSTLERLDILTREALIPGELSHNIKSAFKFLLHLLLQSQLIKKESNMSIDNFIEPEKLSLLEKKTLKEAFHLLPVLRRKARYYFHSPETLIK